MLMASLGAHSFLIAHQGLDRRRVGHLVAIASIGPMRIAEDPIYMYDVPRPKDSRAFA